MNVFDLRDRLVGDYSSYTRSFIKIADPRISQKVNSELNAGGFWPEPLLQLNPTFLAGETIDELVADGTLHPSCTNIFRLEKTETDPIGKHPLLHAHQREAILKSKEGKSYVLTSGNGLGKSLTYRQLIISGVLNSFIFDYLARQRIGGTHLTNDILEQLPLPAFEEIVEWNMPITPSLLELIYTGHDLDSFAQDCGWSVPPFRWDEERRFLLRCELDAAFFHLYLPAGPEGDWRQAKNETPEDLARLKASFPTPRDAVAYIMETFPIVNKKDRAQWGTYRTKDTILETYDAMAEAMRRGRPYTRPASIRCRQTHDAAIHLVLLC